MTGRSIEYVFPPRPETARDARRAAAAVDGTSASAGEFTGVSFDVRPGEIVGLAGLVGAGRREIVETIFGARRADAGTVTVDGKRLRRGSVTSAVRAGVGLAPEERKTQGLMLDEAVYHNITMSTMAGSPAAASSTRGRGAASRRRADRAASTSARPIRTGPSARCPAATSRRSCSPAGCSAAAGCCCSTSRPAASTSAPAPRSTCSIRALADSRRRRRGGVQRGRGGARAGRPGPGGRGRAGRARGPADRASTRHQVLDLVMEGSGRHERRTACAGRATAATSRPRREPPTRRRRPVLRARCRRSQPRPGHRAASAVPRRGRSPPVTGSPAPTTS